MQLIVLQNTTIIHHIMLLLNHQEQYILFKEIFHQNIQSIHLYW